MPIYEFVCNKCGSQFETITTLANAHKIQECPECGAEAGDRVLSVTSRGSSSSSLPSAGGGCGPMPGFG